MEQPDPVASVLCIPEVLDMILDHLDVRSLLSCRLVNKFWNQAASSVMKPRPAWIRVDSVAYQIDGLFKCVTNSQDFPFRGLNITWKNTSTGSNANLKVERYLKKFGKLHTHVRLQEMFCKNAEMLLSHLSEMKFLEVQGCFRYGLTGQVFSLPSLRTLSFKGLEAGIQLNLFRGEYRISSVLKKVVLAASALEKIEHVDCTSQDLIAAIWDSERVQLVSSMTLRGGALCLDVCHKLVANPPTLTSLTISGINSGSSQQVAAIKSVLFASQDTLKTLTVQGSYVQLDGMPVFAQLQELAITTVKRNWSAMYPTLSGFHFPKVRRIRLELGAGTVKQGFVQNHELLQDCETPMETVTLLELGGLLLPNDAKYLAKMLPRVSHIRLKYPRTYGYGNSEFDTVTSSIWLLREFQSVRRLDIQGFPFNTSKDALDGHMPAAPHRKIHTFTSMDQFLTGIPGEEIRVQLGSLPNIKTGSLNSEISRPHGSLIHLTGLEELTIFVTPMGGFTGKDLFSEDPFMTMISVWYALEHMPGLRLTFLCRHSHIEVLKKALEPVQDYVSVVEWTDPEEF